VADFLVVRWDDHIAPSFERRDIRLIGRLVSEPFCSSLQIVWSIAQIGALEIVVFALIGGGLAVVVGKRLLVGTSTGKVFLS
jgi:hypothetical protein